MHTCVCVYVSQIRPSPFCPTSVPPPSPLKLFLRNSGWIQFVLLRQSSLLVFSLLVFSLLVFSLLVFILLVLPPRLASIACRQHSSPRILSLLSFTCSAHTACFLSLLRSAFVFVFLRSERENKNKQTSGNAQMCRCTNRLDSSTVVIPGWLRAGANKTTKGTSCIQWGTSALGGPSWN